MCITLLLNGRPTFWLALWFKVRPKSYTLSVYASKNLSELVCLLARHLQHGSVADTPRSSHPPRNHLVNKRFWKVFETCNIFLEKGKLITKRTVLCIKWVIPDHLSKFLTLYRSDFGAHWRIYIFLTLQTLFQSSVKEKYASHRPDAPLLKFQYGYLCYYPAEQPLIYHVGPHLPQLHHKYSNCNIWYIMW